MIGNVSGNALGGIIAAVVIAVAIYGWRVLKQLGKILHALGGVPLMAIELAALKLVSAEHGSSIAQILAHLGLPMTPPPPPPAPAPPDTYPR